MRKEILRRNTRQKGIILEELRKVKSHPAANEVFRIVRRRIPNISFGTVYRNLNLLRDNGKILELACGRYSCRYDATVTPHYHFYCFKCKGVFDINITMLKDLDRRVSKSYSFVVRTHRIDFYGYCKKCKLRIGNLKAVTRNAGSS